MTVGAAEAYRRGWIDEGPSVPRFKHKERIRWLDADSLPAYMAEWHGPAVHH